MTNCTYTYTKSLRYISFSFSLEQGDIEKHWCASVYLNIIISPTDTAHKGQWVQYNT